VIEDISLVIAEITDGVLPVVRVLESAHSQVREPVQVEHLFEVADLVVRDVQLFKGY